MMKALIKKEFQLCFSPVFCVYILLALLVLIPNYPLGVGTAFAFQAVFLYFNMSRVNRDEEFSLTLPVTRSQIARAKMIVTLIIQGAHLLLCVLAALVANLVLHTTGIFLRPNAAFFGINLFGFAVANAVFLPLVFRRLSKPGLPLVYGLLCFAAIYLTFELLVILVPAVRVSLDGFAPETLWIRLVTLGAGLIAYAVSFLLCFFKVSENFDEVHP